MPKHVEASADAPGVIDGTAIYTLGEFQDRLKLGQHAMRQARRAGLPVRRVGRRGYILGSDALEFFRRVGVPDSQEAST